jgi:hypothetical protein
MTTYMSAVDGIEYDNLIGNSTYNPGLKANRKFKIHGQTANIVASNVANQEVGTVAVPALAAGATGTITISNTLITTTSLVQVMGWRIGTTTPGAGAYVAPTYFAAPASGSVVLNIINPTAVAILSTDFQLWYRIVN